MRQLGTYGQWGNQVIQYMFLRCYAKRHGLVVGAPDWVGRYFYGFHDPLPPQEFPQFNERTLVARHEKCFAEPVPPQGNECQNRDYLGWAQWSTSWYAPDREMLLSLFETPLEPTLSKVESAMDTLRSLGDTVIALHLRRGDAGRMIFFLTPMVWCLQWLHEHWGRFRNPVLFIATEDLLLIPWFRYYAPQIMETLGIQPIAMPPPYYKYPHNVTPDKARQLTFFPDWYILQHADVVLLAESTFGVSAAILNRDLKELWRPRLTTQRFERIPDQWDMRISEREHLSDFPGIPGTQLDKNPAYGDYWGSYKPRHISVDETKEMILPWLRPSRPVTIGPKETW